LATFFFGQGATSDPDGGERKEEGVKGGYLATKKIEEEIDSQKVMTLVHQSPALWQDAHPRATFCESVHVEFPGN